MATHALSVYLGRVGLRAAIATDLWWVDEKHGARVYSLHILWLKLAIYVLTTKEPQP